jgi:hypothetical protein
VSAFIIAWLGSRFIAPEYVLANETKEAAEADVTVTGIKKIEVRFISSRYFEDDSQNLIPQSCGGLAEDSKWATDGSLRELLRSVLDS